MIEKIKYRLLNGFSFSKTRKSCLAVITAVTVAAATLLSYSIYTVNIFDGENTYTVRTLSNNVTRVLSSLGYESNSYKIKNTTVSGTTTSIEIETEFPVYITCGDKTLEITFTGGTVADAIKQAGFSIDEHDFLEPSAETEINDTTYIDFTNIDYVDTVVTENIPYETKTVYSGSLKKGETKTITAGVNGVKEIKYRERIVNGVVAEKTVSETKVLSNPVTEQKVIGSAPAKTATATAVSTSSAVKSISVLTPATEIKLDKNGNPVNYKSKMTVRATAYTYTGNNCATGVAPKPGYIAVNPKVIPYGTKLYIKSPDGSIIYGYAVAADTGGFIRKHPTGIDLFMTTQSACTNFGVRNMEVYILN
ncbi:MAG: G5 domain-containing protein [Clostridia bacterium]|nr:G5 domain-containing protein [Clostridia bacterium]